MNVLICGGRGYQDEAAVNARLDRLTGITAIVHGEEPGAAALAAKWAKAHGISERIVNPVGFEPGSDRNAAILQEITPDLVVVFDGGRETNDMYGRARLAGIAVDLGDPVVR